MRSDLSALHRLGCGLLFFLTPLLAAPASPAPQPAAEIVVERPAALHPFSLLGKNLSESFWGTNTYWHLGAFGLTTVMVKTHADRKIQDFFIEKNPIGQPFAFTMLRLGDATSIILSVSFYGFGSWRDIPTLAAAGAAGTQAVMVNAVYVQSLKVISGRTRPGENNSDDDFFPGWGERVENFKFRHSWPSGHTSSSFSFVASQHAFFPNEKWIPWVGYPIAAVIGLGMVEGDYHWTSEVLAGAIIGTVIGYTTGKNFREEYDRRKAGFKDDGKQAGSKAPKFMLSPTISNGKYAMAVTWYW